MSKIKILFIIFGENGFVFLKYVIVLTVLPECKTDKRKSQGKHGQPME